MEVGMALHTAARRYCLERYVFWAERYAEIVRRGADRKLDGYCYTREALATFPRYNVQSAIRVELERIDTGDCATSRMRKREWSARAKRRTTISLGSRSGQSTSGRSQKSARRFAPTSEGSSPPI